MTVDTDYPVGSIVRFRERDWIVQAKDEAELIHLRPLQGSEIESCGVYLPLEVDNLHSAEFTLPSPEHPGDFIEGQLLRDAARLALRSGAGPFRSFGRISVRPRPYQLVPLMMALKLDPVRLLIADDVGVGKTVEAGLIVRELLERGEVQRMCVLCPPHLCEQWQRELWEKFHIDATIVRSSTFAQLVNQIPNMDQTVYSYFPHLIVSIDFAKGDSQISSFLSGCPDLIIVDEAHTATRPANRGTKTQQLRYELLRKLADKPQRHMLLLTATPHSGVQESFASLLGLLDVTFEKFVHEQLSERERAHLARHMIQRRRADVKKWLGEDTPFPERMSDDVSYELNNESLRLFQDVLAFTRESVQEAGEERHKRRVRYWAALSLLRCLMSSPQAAAEALAKREQKLQDGQSQPEGDEDEDAVVELRKRQILDVISEEAVLDTVPQDALAEGIHNLRERDRKLLSDFQKRAQAIMETGSDVKLNVLFNQISKLLKEGYHPIIFCRFIATAKYVQKELHQQLKGSFRNIRVVAVTGDISDEERATQVSELIEHQTRVLVATDCLSEGIDLQKGFDAVVHYDLPWNPNRLEQREGRVDRYGQRNPYVKTILLYGTNNRIDLTVIRVLIRKAREIQKTLGVTVPVPVESEGLIEAIVNELFEKDELSDQMSFELDFGDTTSIQDVHHQWDIAAHREKESRTRFAQHALRPDDVERELRETDDVLGDPLVVRRFLVNAWRRFQYSIDEKHDGLWLETMKVPNMPGLTKPKSGMIHVGFDMQTSDDEVIIGRNHPLIVWSSDRVLGEALSPSKNGSARAGALYVTTVSTRTVLLLLRMRYRLLQKNKPDLFAEEVVVSGFRREGSQLVFFEANHPEVRSVFEQSVPVSNMDRVEKEDLVTWALGRIEENSDELHRIARERAVRVAEAHNRLRSHAGGENVKALEYPPDVLGIYVLMPGGDRS